MGRRAAARARGEVRLAPPFLGGGSRHPRGPSRESTEDAEDGVRADARRGRRPRSRAGHSESVTGCPRGRGVRAQGAKEQAGSARWRCSFAYDERAMDAKRPMSWLVAAAIGAFALVRPAPALAEPAGT